MKLDEKEKKTLSLSRIFIQSPREGAGVVVLLLLFFCFPPYSRLSGPHTIDIALLPAVVILLTDRPQPLSAVDISEHEKFAFPPSKILIIMDE